MRLSKDLDTVDVCKLVLARLRQASESQKRVERVIAQAEREGVPVPALRFDAGYFQKIYDSCGEISAEQEERLPLWERRLDAARTRRRGRERIIAHILNEIDEYAGVPVD